MPQWLVLVHRIPPRPLYLRAKIRQRLAGVGAIAIKNAVYLLPHGPESLEDLQWIAQEIVAGGGDAHLLEGDFVDGAATDTAVAQFRQERDADYQLIADQAREALKAARGVAAVSELGLAHARLERRLEEVRGIDFFAGTARAGAERALAAIEARLRKDQSRETRMLKANSELHGRIWVTRPGVKVDRMASAWFIRRFVDPRARFRFASETVARGKDEIRFDMVGADFTHDGDRCTLETLVRKVGLPDKGVRAIAEIVHDLDLKDGKFNRPETPGVRVMLDGLMNRCPTDEERIDRAVTLFDDLHQSLNGRGHSRK